MDALEFLFDFAGTVLVGVFLLRFFLQATRASFHNPISAAVVQFTNPVVMPLRKVVPGWGGMDNASLLAAFVIQMLVILIKVILFSYGGLGGVSLSGLLVSTLIEFLLAIIGLYTVLVFFGVLLSWFNRDPGNPLASVIWSLTEPVLRPARRVIPPIGGFDISPVIVLVALQALAIFVSTTVAGALRALM